MTRCPSHTPVILQGYWCLDTPLEIRGSIPLYFPVTERVMQPAVGHKAGAESFSVGDVHIRLWANVRWVTVFSAVVMGAPASLHNGLEPTRVAAGQGLVAVRDPNNRSAGRAVGRPCRRGCSRPAGPTRASAADSRGRTRTAAWPPASASPLRAAPPLASDPDTSPAPASRCRAAACSAARVPQSAERG